MSIVYGPVPSWRLGSTRHPLTERRESVKIERLVLECE